MSKIIGAAVDQGDNQRKSKLRLLHCSFPGECPVLAQGKCIHESSLFDVGCIYGKYTCRNGFTKRAKRYNAKLREFQEEYRRHGATPKGATRVLTVLGEWVWLPYIHIDMCELVPFVRHSKIFARGIPFVKVVDLTPEAVVTLAAFRPHALMGGEIKNYQEKEVPRFLYHLKHTLPDLYAAALALEPGIADKVFALDDVKSVKAQVTLISPGTEVGVKGNWRGIWDGETITTVEGPPDHIIGLYADDAMVSLVIRPKNLVVEVDDRAEIERLWEAGAIKI